MIFNFVFSFRECGWIKDSYPPGSQEIFRLITESNRTQMASKAQQSWNLDGWSLFFSLDVWYQWMNFECVYHIIFTHVGKVYSEILAWIWLRDFVNERDGWEVILIIRSAILVLSFVNTNCLQWLNKGIHSVGLHWLLLDQARSFPEIKFRLEDTVFTKYLLRFQDIILFQLAFPFFSDKNLKNPVHRNLLNKSFSYTSLSFH